MFEFGTDSTDLQRQLKLKAIKGSVIEWKLPVYDVKQSGNGYTIQTGPRFRDDPRNTKVIETFLRISPRDDDDRRYIEQLKTGDVVKVKGMINDESMRSLEIKPAIVVTVDRYVKKTLTDAYGNFDPKLNCWIVSYKQNDYETRVCMRIGRVDKIVVGESIRYYVLALGEQVDKDGHPNGAHVSRGQIGAFVVEVTNDVPKLLASDSEMFMGASGSAPKEWKFVRLGADNYWGWQSEWGDCVMADPAPGDVPRAVCFKSNEILAPYGKKIRNLALGLSGSKVWDESEDWLNMVLTVDSTKTDQKVFPLIVEIPARSNGDKGQPTPARTTKVPFNYKEWKYQPEK